MSEPLPRFLQDEFRRAGVVAQINALLRAQDESDWEPIIAQVFDGWASPEAKRVLTAEARKQLIAELQG